MLAHSQHTVAWAIGEIEMGSHLSYFEKDVDQHLSIVSTTYSHVAVAQFLGMEAKAVETPRLKDVPFNSPEAR